MTQEAAARRACARRRPAVAAGRPRPPGALDIGRMLRREGDLVPPNTVFRALRELIDRGAARKVMVARGYAPGSGAGMISLYCRACGTVTAGRLRRPFPTRSTPSRLRRASPCRAISLKSPVCASAVPDTPHDVMMLRARPLPCPGHFGRGSRIAIQMGSVALHRPEWRSARNTVEKRGCIGRLRDAACSSMPAMAGRVGDSTGYIPATSRSR